MPQPNCGTCGTAPTSAPIMDKGGSKPNGGDIRFGMQTPGIKGSGTK